MIRNTITINPKYTPHWTNIEKDDAVSSDWIRFSFAIVFIYDDISQPQ